MLAMLAPVEVDPGLPKVSIFLFGFGPHNLFSFISKLFQIVHVQEWYEMV